MRIRRKDVEKLKILQTKAKRKKSRLKRIYDVEKNISFPDITDFSSRKDFNKYVKRLETFTDRRSDRYKINKNGIVVPFEEYRHLRNQLKQINKQKRKFFKKYKDLPFMSYGKKTDEKLKDRKLMGDPRYDFAKEYTFNFDSIKSQKGLEALKRAYDRRLKSNYWKTYLATIKKNYLIAVKKQLGKAGKPVLSLVKKMTNEQFFKKFLTEDIVNFTYLYTHEQVEEKVKQLKIVLSS